MGVVNMITIKQKPMELPRQTWIRLVKEVYKEGEHKIDQRNNRVISYYNTCTIFSLPHIFLDECFIDNPRLERSFFEELITPHKGEFAYTYGNRINEHNQIKEVIKKLKEDKNTRRAVIDIFRPTDISSGKEIPCATQLHFNFNKRKLNLTCIMRSNDVVGAYPSDVYGFIHLLKYIGKKTGLPVGLYTHIVTDTHIILDHYEDKLKQLRIK